MPSTPTNPLRLEQQALGENLNTWGDDRLNRVLRGLANAIAGVESITLSNGDNVLTAKDFEPDQARAAVLRLQGSITADAKVVIPDETKTYIVTNGATLNGKLLEVGTAAGQAVRVYEDTSIFIVCDGTDTVAVRPTTFDNKQLRNIADPTDAQDGATKAYVDAQAWAASNGALPFWTVRSSPATLQVNERVLADMAAGPYTLSLPDNPATGWEAVIHDALRLFDAKPLTVDGNGNTIEGDPTLTANVRGATFALVYNGVEWKVSW